MRGPVLTITCPACGLVIADRWEIVFQDPDETVTYGQCSQCSQLWVTRRQ